MRLSCSLQKTIFFLLLLFISTSTGRARAWLRLAIMQKKLADYFRTLVEQRDDILSEFFEPQALLRSEESALIVGLLVSLNVVDCNICVKVFINSKDDAKFGLGNPKTKNVLIFN